MINVDKISILCRGENMDKTRDEMNGNQRMLLSYLEPLVPEDDVLMGMADFKPGVICFAIQVAGEHDVQSRGALKYLRAIIAGWKRLKVTTLDQAKKAAAGDEFAGNSPKISRLHLGQPVFIDDQLVIVIGVDKKNLSFTCSSDKEEILSRILYIEDMQDFHTYI